MKEERSKILWNKITNCWNLQEAVNFEYRRRMPTVSPMCHESGTEPWQSKDPPWSSRTYLSFTPALSSHICSVNFAFCLYRGYFESRGCDNNGWDEVVFFGLQWLGEVARWQGTVDRKPSPRRWYGQFPAALDGAEVFHQAILAGPGGDQGLQSCYSRVPASPAGRCGGRNSQPPLLTKWKFCTARLLSEFFGGFMFRVNDESFGDGSTDKQGITQHMQHKMRLLVCHMSYVSVASMAKRFVYQERFIRVPGELKRVLSCTKLGCEDKYPASYSQV